MSDEDLMTASAMARRLGISVSSFERWAKVHIEAGKLKRYVFGPQLIRYSYAEVKACAREDRET